MHEFGLGIRDPLFFIGVIENNVDPRKEGRVQVRAFGVHGSNDDVPRDDLPWAICVKGDYDPNGAPGSGLPGLNDWVFGVFVDGRDAQQPLVLGMIPTQMTVPITSEFIAKNGWGWIPGEHAKQLAPHSHPEMVGQPSYSREGRGEYAQETHINDQIAGRTENVSVGGDDAGDMIWSEPEYASNTKYPMNKVIKNGKIVIEMDNTEDAERLMIWGPNGSYVQIDARGTTTVKTASDKFEVIDRKQHVVVGQKGNAGSTVTIYGDSHVKVIGNKTEEITGDYQQLVRGNHLLSVGGQSNIIASEQLQMRAADVKLQANVGTMAINAAKELQFSTQFGNYGTIAIKAEKIMVDATDKLNLRGNTQVNIQSIAEMNMSAITFNQLAAEYNLQASLNAKLTSGLSMDIKGGISLAVEGGTTAHIKSPFIYMDEYVFMATGGARSAIPAVVAPYFAVPPVGIKAFEAKSGTPEIAWYAAEVEAPEPVAKSTTLGSPADPKNNKSGSYTQSRGTSNMTAAEGSERSRDSSGGGTSFAAQGTVSAAIQSAVAPLLDFIGNIESDGYDDYWRPIKRAGVSPPKPLSQMTIQEVLDWQESIDSRFGSEASGRYQFMEDTLRGYNNDRRNPTVRPSLAERAGLSLGDMFSPINQDKMAIQLMRGRGLNAFLAGRITREEFANNLAHEWASLPLVTGANRGASAYAGDSVGNRSLTRVEEFLAVLDQVKSSHQTIANEQSVQDAQSAAGADAFNTDSNRGSSNAGPNGSGGPQ